MSRKNLAYCIPFLLSSILLWAATRIVSANDHIFPPAPVAKAAIDFDARGFLIHGKRTFIVSAGMEYARVPRALWRDRLLRLKRAGFNCVEMYTFWNWHEPQEGKFNFTGDHDLDAYLKLVHQMGMYAICRVGPYYCAEWDSGGYPLWLRFKTGMAVRQDDPAFEQAVSGFFGKLIPIVAANQINRGGSVILVQLENEDPQGWGTEEPNAYFTFLRTRAVSLGLQVPYFFSGLHHGGDPAGDGHLDDPTRPNPWFTTEFWSVWYDHYGPTPTDASDFGRRTWKIIAHGGSGYNYYMAHGGSNFGYTNDDEDAASYDYGAAVGQAGDPRPMYYTFKRCAWFARSFQDILEDATDASGQYQDDAAGGISITARTSPAGSIEFLDNPGGSSAPAQIHPPSGIGTSEAAPITLAPGEIMPVVRDYALSQDVTLRWAPARILGMMPQGNTTTLVAYGPAGTSAVLAFSAPPSARVYPAANWQTTDAIGTRILRTTFPSGQPSVSTLSVGASRVRVLAMSDSLADRTWFVDAGGQPDVVSGPSYVGDAAAKGHHVLLAAERPWQGAVDVPTLVYPPTGPALALDGARSPAHPMSPTLSPWQVQSGMSPAQAGFDDHRWLTSAQPQQMGVDGDQTADAWYRASVDAPEKGQYLLHATAGGDRAVVFLDGARVGSGSLKSAIAVTLPSGRHKLAVFTAHDGRNKMFGYLGSIAMNDPKGLAGLVTICKGDTTSLTDWKMLKAAGPDDVHSGPPPPSAPGWQNYTVGQDAFGHQPGYAWFQTTLPASIGAATAFLHFGSIDDTGTIFLGSREVGHHEGWSSPFDVSVPPGPTATLTVFVQNIAGAGGLSEPLAFSATTAEARTSVWKMRGGPGDPFAPVGWKLLAPTAAFQGPAFFRTTFVAPPPPAFGAHPIWRVVSTRLGHGSVWVNGHNLGRYPEKIPIKGLYVPECWLQPGRNSLVIFDEDGKRPDAVQIAAETAASRDVLALVGQ